MAINKLNKTFASKQILTAEEMNQITSKIDKVIDGVNSSVEEAPKDGNNYIRSNGQWTQLPNSGGGTVVVDSQMSSTSVNPVQNKVIKKYVDERTNELNISNLYPTNGNGGTNKYTLTGAIAQVPSEYRTIVGLKITFVNNETSKPETWVYNGGTFTSTNSWSQGDGSEGDESGGNLILEWNTDAATTRKQVPVNERKAGMQISYLHPESSWVNEQYIGTAVSDGEWAKDANWEQAVNQQQINNILASSNGLLYNVCYSDIEAAKLIRQENRRINLSITYTKNIRNKFSVYVFGTSTYGAGGSGAFFAKIDGIDYTIPYKAVSFADFKSVRSTVIEYFNQYPLDGWSIEIENDGLRFTKESGVDETFYFSGGKPLIEEFELSFIDDGRKYTTKSNTCELSVSAMVFGGAVNCDIPKYTSIQRIVDTITYSFKPNSTNNSYGCIKTERLSDTSFRATFDAKWNGRPVFCDPNMHPSGDKFRLVISDEISVKRTNISSYVRDIFNIGMDITSPEGQYDRIIQFRGKDTTNKEWFNIQNWYELDTSSLRSELERRTLWNKKDKSVEIDITDGKPIFLSLSQFSSANGLYSAEFFDINGASIGSYSINRVAKYASANIVKAIGGFLPNDIAVRKDGWTYLHGYNFGAAKVVLTFNVNVPNSPYFDDLYILREDDFNNIVGGIEDEFKINLATRDMATFAGGFNNMLDEIFKKNPWQKLAFVTPIYRQGRLHEICPFALPNAKCSSEVVEKLAKYWNQPCIDLSKLGLWIHKEISNAQTIMPDKIHVATSNPDVRIYVTLEGVAGSTGSLEISDNDFCSAASIDVIAGDNADTLLQKIHDGISVKENMVKSLDLSTKSVLIHFDTSKYDANSNGNQKNNIPKITSTLENITVTTKQPDNQCRVTAKYLAAQLTSLFGDLKGVRILWIGTSIPAGNTYGYARGEEYPLLIQNITGCIMDNASYPGSYLRKYNPAFIGNKLDGKPILTGSWNYNTSEGNTKFLSLEGILKKINTIEGPDIIVFDHGINDEWGSKEWALYDWDNIFRED